MIALVLAGVAGASIWLGLPRALRLVAGLSRDATYAQLGFPRNAETDELLEAFERCGGESTGAFEGKYVVDVDSIRANSAASSPAPETAERRAARAQILELEQRRYANFVVMRDRIRSGTDLVQELCLTKVIERTDT
jgi:hypothetical protein